MTPCPDTNGQHCQCYSAVYFNKCCYCREPLTDDPTEGFEDDGSEENQDDVPT